MNQFARFKISGNFLAFFLIVLSNIGSVYAQENTAARKLEFNAGIAEKVAYDDNIFLKRDKTHDFINSVTPSFDFTYNDQNPVWSASGGYLVDIVNYFDYGENDYLRHAPSASFVFHTPVNLYGSFDENYNNTADPYGSDDHYGEGRKTRRNNNKVDFTIGYELSSHLALEGAYINNIYRFYKEEDKWRNKDDNAFSSSLVYKLTPKTSALFTYRQTGTIFPEQNDGIAGWSSSTSEDTTKREYTTGFRISSHGKLSGSLMMGYESQNFENEVDRYGHQYTDISDWSASVDLQFKATQKNQVNLTLERKIRPSNTIEASSQEDTSLMIGYTQNLMHSFVFILAAGWDLWDYKMFNELALPEKKITIYSAKTGINYIIREWLTTGIIYEYRTKNASSDQYNEEEYVDNVAAFTISATY